MITIQINNNGFFRLNRAGKMKMQICPYTKEDPCGDWCPLFREPIYLEDETDVSAPTEVVLEICNRTFYPAADEFEDLRG